MPELPEVDTIRRQLAPLLIGRCVASAWAFQSAKFASGPLIVGSTFTAVARRGKYLIIATDGPQELVLHMGMTGHLELHAPPAASRAITDGSMRACWQLDDGSCLVMYDIRRFGRVAVVPNGDYRSLPTLARLGTEPFDELFTGELLYRLLRTSRQSVKAQLLGQRVVAGVGNIYADEALWRSRIHPMATHIGLARADRLRTALVEVLGEGLAHGGTRLRNYRSLDGDTGLHQLHLDCYGRAGLPCNRCGTLLIRLVVAGRGTTMCPRCQRR